MKDANGRPLPIPGLCATLRSSSVSMHGCDEGPVRHLWVGPMAWLCGAVLRGVAGIRGAALVGGRRLGASQLGPIQHSATRQSESTAAVAARIAEMSVDAVSSRLDVGHGVGHGYNRTPRGCS